MWTNAHNQGVSLQEKRRRRLLWGLLAFLLLLMAFSLCIGRYPLSLNVIWKALFSPGIEGTEEKIILSIRLPRVCGAVLVGAGLSGAGLLFQMVFHHPMATPDLLGTSSAASFGAALALLLGGGTATVTASGFVWGIVSALPVMLLSRKPRGGRIGLILTGLVIGSLFSGAVSCIKLLADESNRLPAITYWLMGSLSGVRMGDVLPCACVILPICAALLLIRYRLNLLNLSQEEALSMGIRIHLLRGTCLLGGVLMTAASVSLCGVVGWVGLFLPNLCRRLVGDNTRLLLPCTLLTGGLFLLMMDNLSRTLLATEIPLGILTAALGAPSFLLLYLGRSSEDA